jgi:hypothetical protein
MKNSGELSQILLDSQRETHILLVSESGTKSKSGNWLHFQCVETQWDEEERAAVDTILDTKLARIPESCQNAVRVTPLAANAKASHFITIIRYEALSPNLSRKP